mgnify:CR=1 FL=1
MLKTSISVILFLSLCQATSVLAQGQLLVGSPQEEYLRRQQLLGKHDTLSSFLIRPLDAARADTSFYKSIPLAKWATLSLMPISVQTRYMDKHPYSWNDGSMLPLSGYQQLFSAGFAIKSGPLHIQFYPEYHYAENQPFEGFPLNGGNVLWQRYFNSQLNFIDTPESFGTSAISNFYLGQSFIKLDLGPMQLGWSNENIWWGPGKRNSLVMSNNARGFQHLTLNTRRPIQTPIGHFELQVIGGRLENSGYDPPNAFFVQNGSFVFRDKDPDWRYLSGFTMNYQPKWIRGLSLGASRVVQQYSATANENNDWFGSFSNLFRSNDAFNDIVRDQLASLYIRYYSTKTNTEFYFEFARNDAAFDFRDFFLEPNHSAGYLFGFTKLFPFQKKKNQFIEANAEWTILEQSTSRMFRNASTFYIHNQVRQGYTHRGEILGAGIGPSSNSQTLSVSYVKAFDKLGIRLERYTHNEDLFIDLLADTGDWMRPWVDISAALFGAIRLNKVLIEGEFNYIKSINYQYQIVKTAGFEPGYADVNNYSLQFNLHYFF